MILTAIIATAVLPVYDLATNSIAKRIAGVDPAVCLSRFLDYPPSKGKLGFPRCLFENPYPANDKFWLKGVDFSCVSPWNDGCGSLRAGTAISKRHIVFANHFALWKGVRIEFVGEDGGVCPVRITGTKRIPGSDIAIGALDYELTPNIHPAKILPEDCEKFIGNGENLPVVTFNQREQVFLTELHPMPTNGAPRPGIGSHIPVNPAWRGFRENIVKGDSGNPAFLLIGGQPILVYCLSNGPRGYGPALHLYRCEIQAAMDELCPGYKLEEFDFEKVRCNDGK